jgi:8-oxo-dGTP diphosphatase
MNPDAVLAAGAVCWRKIDGQIHVLVIHREDRRDISLPKGKLDKGESFPQTAVREIKEETGLSVSLGLPLGVTHYTMPSGKPKEVHYWAAHVTAKAIAKSTFKPNSEVAALEWLPIDKARRELHYDADREILDLFTSYVTQGVTETFAVILLRHAKAQDPSKFDGPDRDRPLTGRGEKQAAQISSALAAFGPKKLVSSVSLRCQQTIAPLAELLDKDVRFVDEISQHAFVDDHPAVRAIVGKRVRRGKTSVLCSHGPVIPELLRELALATGTALVTDHSRAANLDTASFSVFHLNAKHPSAGIVAVETHDSLI